MALRAAWLLAQGTSQDTIRNVALSSEQQQPISLLDTGDDSSGDLSPSAITRRTPSARYDETPGEPIRPGRGVSRAAGIKPQSAAEQQTLSGETPGALTWTAFQAKWDNDLGQS